MDTPVIPQDDQIEPGSLFGKYRKVVAAVVTAFIVFATLVIASAPTGIQASEWLSLVLGLAGALGVYVVKND